jgi:hypothetical protein
MDWAFKKTVTLGDPNSSRPVAIGKLYVTNSGLKG